MDFSRPLVSIIIVNWNGAPYIEKCVKSLLEMDYENFEIIVVDNNSSDKSVEILQRLSSRLKIIINHENLGFAQACNVGFKASRGRLIGFFNSDALSDRKWLGELVTALSSSENAAAAGGPIFYFETPNKVWFSGGKIDAITGFSWHIGQNTFGLPTLTEFDTLSGCAILIKRSVLEKTGCLDKSYFLYGDDVDLSITIGRLGMELLFVPSAISWHLVSASKKRAPRFTYQMKAKCDLRLILKNFPLRFLPSALFFRGAVFPLCEALYFHKNPGFLLLDAKAFIDNMQELRHTLKERQRAEQKGKANIKGRFSEIIK